ncbi:MAG TPA: endonuclease/exonuclease/phosphatase family protein [Streptosporangiaceae bacterium]|jgi:endonuclease/exonuclease/phosphatase family metal-dependent hydrolase|nr:endonuclease/exonuclease/phosphatase family protein [Streptosporangiaceae bacterium]
MAGAGAKATRLSWTVAGGLAAWAVARASAADRVRPTENAAVPLISFTPQVARAAPWAALGLRLIRQRGPAATVTMAAAALDLLVRPRRIARSQPANHGPTLRVLTLNLYVGRADAEAVVAQVRRAAADVLFVQELTGDAMTRLQQAGLDDLMPYTQLELWGGTRGSGIYSRFRLSEGPFVALAHAAQPTALLTLPGGKAVDLICVHPSAPTQRRAGAGRWRQELGALPPPGGRPRVVAGDFNATLDHAAFRDVLRLGYADSAQQTGSGLIPTWGPPGRGAVLTLDHVLADQSCAVRGYSVHVVPGSDHRAVSAEIQLSR